MWRHRPGGVAAARQASVTLLLLVAAGSAAAVATADAPSAPKESGRRGHNTASAAKNEASHQHDKARRHAHNRTAAVAGSRERANGVAHGPQSKEAAAHGPTYVLPIVPCKGLNNQLGAVRSPPGSPHPVRVPSNHCIAIEGLCGCLGAWVPGLLGAWVPWLLSASRPTVTDSHLRVCPPAPFPNRVWHALLVLQLATTLWQCAVCEAHQCVHAWGAIGDRQMLLPPLFASCYSWDDHPNTRVDFGEWFDVSHSDGPAHCHNHRTLPPLWLRPTHES